MASLADLIGAAEGAAGGFEYLKRKFITNEMLRPTLAARLKALQAQAQQQQSLANISQPLDAAKLQLAQAQASAYAPRSAAQLKILQDTADKMDLANRLRERYPESGLGSLGQMIALMHMIRKEAPQQPVAPQAQPQQRMPQIPMQAQPQQLMPQIPMQAQPQQPTPQIPMRAQPSLTPQQKLQVEQATLGNAPFPQLANKFPNVAQIGTLIKEGKVTPQIMAQVLASQQQTPRMSDLSLVKEGIDKLLGKKGATPTGLMAQYGYALSQGRLYGPNSPQAVFALAQANQATRMKQQRIYGRFSKVANLIRDRQTQQGLLQEAVKKGDFKLAQQYKQNISYLNDSLAKTTETTQQLNQQLFVSTATGLYNAMRPYLSSYIKYVGLKGRAKLEADKALEATGTDVPDYDRYRQFLNMARFLTGETVKFTKSPAVESIYNQLESAAAPGGIALTPKGATALFNNFGDIINASGQALKPGISQIRRTLGTGAIVGGRVSMISPSGKRYNVSSNQVNAAIKQGWKRG